MTSSGTIAREVHLEVHLAEPGAQDGRLASTLTASLPVPGLADSNIDSKTIGRRRSAASDCAEGTQAKNLGELLRTAEIEFEDRGDRPART